MPRLLLTFNKSHFSSIQKDLKSNQKEKKIIADNNILLNNVKRYNLKIHNWKYEIDCSGQEDFSESFEVIFEKQAGESA